MFYIGLDIGGTKCAAVLGEQKNEEMTIIKKVRFDTYPNTPKQLIEKFDAFIAEVAGNHKIQGIGISCGGPLDSGAGVILSPPNLPGWNDIEIVSHFKNKWNINTYLQNDANACAVAEWKFGAGKGYENVVFLTFGTGLGAGLILNGRLYSGSSDMAGEAGHIRLTKSGPVGYGKPGSFEGYCSGGGIAQLGKAAVEKQLKNGSEPLLFRKAGRDMNKITAKLIGDLAESGDGFSKKIYAECGKKLGEGLSIIIDILNPQLIIMGSIYTRSEALLKAHALKVIEKETLIYSRSACRLAVSALGEQIGDIAALSVATGLF